MEESSISSNGHVHGYGNPYQLSEHFWNDLTNEDSTATYNNYEEVDVEVGIDARCHNDYQDVIVYEEAEVETEDYTNNDSCRNISSGGVVYTETDDDEIESYVDTRYCIEDFQDMTVDSSHVEVPHDSFIEVSCGKPTYHAYASATNPSDNLVIVRFYEVTNKGDWTVMEEIGTTHPETLTKTVFHNQGTALHQTLWYGQDRVEIAKRLVDLMTPKGLETKDQDGYTALALAVLLHHDNDLLGRMIEKNVELLKVGAPDKIPIVVASSKGFTDTTEFLYRQLTDKQIVDVNFLNQCIGLNLFDIARELLELTPDFIDSWDDDYVYPTHALAKAIAALQISNIQHKKSRDRKPSSVDQGSDPICKAYELLQLIIRVKTVNHRIDGWKFLEDAMMEAAKHGIIKFITEMLEVNRELISINDGSKNMFWHAIINRQEKVFNLIYAFNRKKDMLLSFNLDEEGNPAGKGSTEKTPNILHFAAKCPSSSVLDRISGPALQMQREIQWFKAVQEVTIPRYRQDLNESGQTPYTLFLEEHKILLEQGEKSMKKTAAAASTVGGLILTTMFGAALTVASAVYQTPTSGPYGANALFNAFLVFATLSVCSCTTSIVVFLRVLASRYSPEDFLTALPRKFMLGFWLLFVSIATMMLAYGCGLYTMLKGQKIHFVIIPIFLVSLVPVIIFFVYICPLLSKICRSTKNTVFDESTRLPEAKKESTYESC